MAFEIKVKNLNWKDIKLICPCGGVQGINHSFDLKQTGGLIYYYCVNSECVNNFSSEVQIKALQKLEEYMEEKGKPDGFSHYFRIKENRMRLRYLNTEQITANHRCYIIEVANMTTMDTK